MTLRFSVRENITLIREASSHLKTPATWLDIVSLACYITWSFMLWNSSSFTLFTQNSNYWSQASNFQGFATALAALMCVVFSARIAPLYRNKLIMGLFACICALSVATFSMNSSLFNDNVVTLSAFFLSGIGSTLRLASEERISEQGISYTMVSVACAYVLGFIFFSFLNIIKESYLHLFVATLPIISMVILLIAEHQHPLTVMHPSPDPSRSSSTNLTDTPEKSSFQLFLEVPWKYIVLVALFYCAFGATRTQGVMGGIQALTVIEVLTAFPMLVCILAVIVGFLFWHSYPLHAFVLAALCIVGSCILSCMSGIFFSGTAFAGASLGAEIAKYTVWFMLVNTVVRDGTSSLVCLALLRCAQWMGSTLGQLFTLHITNSYMTGIVVLSILTGALIILLYTVSTGTSSLTHIEKQHDTSPSKATPARVDKVEIISKEAKLTPREIEVLRLWVSGYTGSYIEKTLYISHSTLKTHLSHIYQKTQTKNRDELIDAIENIHIPKPEN